MVVAGRGRVGGSAGIQVGGPGEARTRRWTFRMSSLPLMMGIHMVTSNPINGARCSWTTHRLQSHRAPLIGLDVTMWMVRWWRMKADEAVQASGPRGASGVGTEEGKPAKCGPGRK